MPSWRRRESATGMRMSSSPAMTSVGAGDAVQPIVRVMGLDGAELREVGVERLIHGGHGCLELL